MKTKEPKTAEQYIVKRVNELERENRLLETDLAIKKSNLESAHERLRQVDAQIKFLVSLFKVEDYEVRPDEIVHIYKTENIWSSHDEMKFNKLRDIIDYYTEPELPF